MGPGEFEQLLSPVHTALCLVECQNGIIGSEATFPALAEVMTKRLPDISTLLTVARIAGVTVVHATAEVLPGRWGANNNAPIFDIARRSKIQLKIDTMAAKPLPEFGPEPGDIVVPRFRGLSPFSGTELVHLLHNEGITTVVLAGVSLNVAIPNAVFDLVNTGFQVVVARDCVAGTPPSYGDQVLENSLRYVATLVESVDLLSVWRR